jgi:hypothetical protein
MCVAGSNSSNIESDEEFFLDLNSLMFNNNSVTLYSCISLTSHTFQVWEPPMGTSHTLPKAVSKQQLDKQDYHGNQQL